MIYGNKFLPKEKTYIESEDITSVCYTEYLERKSLLESCTDESTRSILEAQVQVLYEVSIKDIIEKIKEMWEKFKAWVKKIWDAIFHNKKQADEKAEKAKKDLDEAAKKCADEVINSIFPKADKVFEKNSILRKSNVPCYIFNERDEKLKYNIYSVDKFKFPGEISSRKTDLDEIFSYIMKYSSGKYIGTDIDMSNDMYKHEVDNLKAEVEKIKYFNIQMLPIIDYDPKDKNQFADYVVNRLRNYGVDMNGNTENNLRAALKMYSEFNDGFKKDYIKVQGYKNMIDKRIHELDISIKRNIKESQEHVKDAIEYNNKLSRGKEELNNIDANTKYYQQYKYNTGKKDFFGYDMHKYTNSEDEIEAYYKDNDVPEDKKDFGYNKDREGRYNSKKAYTKTVGRLKHTAAENAKEASEFAKTVRQCITVLQDATNAFSSISTKIVIGQQKNTHEMEKLTKIVKDMIQKADKDNEI